MENYIDYKQVRSILLAAVICMASYYTLYLGYSLVQNFIDIFAISLVTSLAIKPCKDYICMCYILVSTSEEKYPVISRSIFFSFSSHLNRIFTNHFLVNIFLAVALAVLCNKISFGFVGSLIFAVLVFDLALRGLCDLALKIAKMLKLERFQDFFETILTISLILAMVLAAVLFQTIAIGTIVFEMSEHGKFLIDWMSEFFGAESLEHLRNSAYFQTIDKNIEKMWGNLTQEIQKEQESCSAYIEQTKDLPILHSFLFESLLQLEDFLSYLKLSSHQILTLYYQNPAKFHELCWMVLSLPLKIILNNIGGVAIAISTIIERVVLYFTLVYILVNEKTSALEKVLYVVPLDNKTKFEIISDISSTISGITASFLIAAISHYAVTLLLYSGLGLELKHTFAVLTAVTGLFPFFGPWFVNLPMIFWLLVKWDYRAIVLFLVEYLVVGYVDGEIYSAHLQSFNPTLIGIVIVLGIYKFGTFGIFYGPLIMSLGYLIFKLGKQLNQ